MNILVITGSSGSLKDTDTGDVVKRELGPDHNYRIQSPKWFAIRRAMRWIRKTKGPIVLIGKSYGGWKVHRLLEKNSKYFESKYFKVLLIDPYAPWWTAKRLFSKKQNVLEGSLHWVWYNDTKCIYQRCKWPMGAYWNNATNTEIHNTDHTKIVTDPKTLELIRETVK